MNYTDGTSNSYTVSSTDLLQTSVSSVAASGSFTNETTGGDSTPAGYGVLTDGVIGTDHASRSGIGSGSELTYTLNTSIARGGYDLSAINIYSSWGDAGRVDPNVMVSYSLITAPTVFIPLTTASFTYNGFPDPWVESSVVSSSGGDLLDNVAAVRFDFPNQENGFVGYSELDVLGRGVAGPEPSTYAMILLGAGAMALYLRRRATRA